MVSWRDVYVLYLRELRGALRERSIVVGSLLVPMFLYPVMLWVIFTAISFVGGQEERFVSRLALVDLPSAHQGLNEKVAAIERVELVAPPADPEAELAAGEIDAVARFRPAAEAPEGERPEDGGRLKDGRLEDGRLQDNIALTLLYDASKDRSRIARRRLEEVVDAYRSDWLARAGEELGLDVAARQRFRIARRNVAGGRAMGSFVLGLIAPMMMIIMIAVGCFYPAVDATAGERERGTWETLMTVAASRTSIVVAKFLYVGTMGLVAGLLNLIALAVSLRAVLAPMLGASSGEIELRLPLAALPLMVVVALLLALFMAAGMMLFAAFARTFKEGQAMVGPFYLLMIMPPLLVNAPDLTLTPRLALVPVANVALLLRDALAGRFSWPAIALTLAVEVVLIVLLLLLARTVLRVEEVMADAPAGSLPRFLKERLLTRRKGGTHA